MGKSIYEQDFFARMAEAVAKDLLGKYVCTKDGETYLIIETEAYYHTEKCCYGYEQTKKEAERKHLVCLPLFERPGTWCVYGGQLLLSVGDERYSDNVLIKRVKTMDGAVLGPHPMANHLHLYKFKPGYCDCHGKFSLCEESGVFLKDGEETPEYGAFKRKNINSAAKRRFTIKGEEK